MEFVPIRTKTLIPDMDLHFDIFLKLSDRFLLYIKNGDGIEKQRLTNLVEKKVKQLFIHDSDEKNYQDFLDQSLAHAKESPNVTSLEKAGLSVGLSQNALDEIKTQASLESFKLLERSAKSIMELVGKGQDVLKQVYQSFEGESEEGDIYSRHAISAASLASCLAEKLSLSEQQIRRITVSTLLMDIGLYKLSPDQQKIFLIPEEKMSSDQKKIYQTHPELSKQFLEGKDFIEKEILELIYAHEERKTGSGFPKATKSISKENEIMGLATVYDRLVTYYGLSHQDALFEIKTNQIGNFELEMIKIFQKVLKEQNL